MKSPLALALDVDGPDRLDQVVRLVEDEWLRRGDLDLDLFLKDHLAPDAADSAEQRALLGAIIKADLRCRFERGQSPGADRYLSRYPQVSASNSQAISLIYEEYCLLEERGEAIDVSSFCDRYPEWKDSLTSQLQYHRLYSQTAGAQPSSPRFPEVGGTFEEFELLSLIGKGGSARVFLARDLSLGGKRVVLKVSLDRGQEPQTQGALDHPNIVSVNSVVFQRENELRGLSMPYRPGLPLDEIIKQIKPASRPTRARVLWQTLIDARPHTESNPDADSDESLPGTDPRGDGWDGFPTRGSYASGVAWIALVLTRALSYAHRKHTFHRDVKPGNVLLSIDHGPQLLDFNLAQSPHSVQQAQSAMLGGTLPYMAPEQIEAFLNPDLWGKVGGKADIYSLGLVVRELLTGLPPDLPGEKLPPPRAMRELLDRRSCLATDVRTSNPAIPHGLEAIVRRCLEFKPERRYPDAHTLAEDLARFLSRRPLLFAVNASRRERVQNWVIRNRRSLGVNAAYLVVIAGLLWQPIAKRLQPSLETLPEFHSAVSALEKNDYAGGMKLLMELVSRYPDDPLPKFYLALASAQADSEPEDSAQIYFRDAMEHPEAQERLMAFAQRRPKIVPLLRHFAATRLQKLRILSIDENNKNSSGSVTDQTAANRKVARDRLNQTLRQALRMAIRLDPESEELITQMAAVEEHFGEYASAHQRLKELIESGRAKTMEPDAEKILSWTTQLSRIRIIWARKLQESKLEADREEALDHLRTAVSDLEKHSSHVAARILDPRNLPYMTESFYQFLYIKTEAILSLGELEQGQELFEFAERRFGDAQKAFHQLERYAPDIGASLPQNGDLFRQRIRAGLNAAKTRRAEKSPARSPSPSPERGSGAGH